MIRNDKYNLIQSEASYDILWVIHRSYRILLSLPLYTDESDRLTHSLYLSLQERQNQTKTAYTLQEQKQQSRIEARNWSDSDEQKNELRIEESPISESLSKLLQLVAFEFECLSIAISFFI